jgi:hypothetical protein
MSAETAALLPAGFEDFEPFLVWALPRQVERSDKKMASTFEEIKALYDFAMADDHLVKALRHCDQFPLAELPPDAARLFHITLSIAEVRPNVELYGQVRSPLAHDAALPSRLPPTEDYDQL